MKVVWGAPPPPQWTKLTPANYTKDNFVYHVVYHFEAVIWIIKIYSLFPEIFKYCEIMSNNRFCTSGFDLLEHCGLYNSNYASSSEVVSLVKNTVHE